jgi:SEC-C motif-containing protein
MRSRYSAYAKHEVDHIVATCVRNGERDIDVEQTRRWSEKSQWLGLKIVSSEKGSPSDTEGTVEFIASYVMDGLKDEHRERAKFVRKDGDWLYDDGEIVPTTIVRSTPKVGRNDPCSCGSGKKYKHCCGKSA